MNDFFKTIRSFLTEYLPKQRCYSENTIKSYRITLNLFIEYLRSVKKLTISSIDFTIVDRALIIGYLDWLEQTRHCSITSRNQRLMALRSFFKYAGTFDCAQIALQLDVEDVPVKNEPGRIVEFFSEDALQAILLQPNVTKPKGLRDQFLMILMYDTAARCGEILNLKIRDLRINTKHPVVHLTGKGNKTRPVPLMTKTVEHCRRYLEIFHPDSTGSDDEFVFYTVIHGKRHPMSDDSVAAFTKKYGESARQHCSDVPKKVHPHQFRHTRAIHFYRDGMPLALLAEFLGHVSVETTKIYAYADTEMKRLAMEKADQNRKVTPSPNPIWKNNEEMILKLSGLK